MLGYLISLRPISSAKPLYKLLFIKILFLNLMALVHACLGINIDDVVVENPIFLFKK